MLSHFNIGLTKESIKNVILISNKIISYGKWEDFMNEVIIDET